MAVNALAYLFTSQHVDVGYRGSCVQWCVEGRCHSIVLARFPASRQASFAEDGWEVVSLRCGDCQATHRKDVARD